jgi:hypothetical protein
MQTPVRRCSNDCQASGLSLKCPRADHSAGACLSSEPVKNCRLLVLAYRCRGSASYRTGCPRYSEGGSGFRFVPLILCKFGHDDPTVRIADAPWPVVPNRRRRGEAGRLRVNRVGRCHKDGQKLKYSCTGVNTRNVAESGNEFQVDLAFSHKRRKTMIRGAVGSNREHRLRGCQCADATLRRRQPRNHSFGSFPDVLPEAMYDYARRIESNPRPVYKMSAPRPLA